MPEKIGSKPEGELDEDVSAELYSTNAQLAGRQNTVRVPKGTDVRASPLRSVHETALQKPSSNNNLPDNIAGSSKNQHRARPGIESTIRKNQNTRAAPNTR